jgi:hypothetical protein
VQDVSALAGCVNLRTLDLSGCSQLRSVSALRGACTHLTNLALHDSGCADKMAMEEGEDAPDNNVRNVLQFSPSNERDEGPALY